MTVQDRARTGRDDVLPCEIVGTVTIRNRSAATERHERGDVAPSPSAEHPVDPPGHGASGRKHPPAKAGCRVDGRSQPVDVDRRCATRARGRTVREFVTAILLVPVAFSLVWMATFAGASLFVELNVASGGIIGPLTERGRAVALFEMLSHYPFTLLTSLVATATLLTFFITSAESGALATSFIVSGGQREPSRR